MSRLSARYATPTLIVLLLALVPTVVNSYIGRQVVETPLMPDALPTVLDGRTSAPTARRASTIRREFDSSDWVERSYATAGAAPITVLAVRSYDMKRLYHHPELAVTEHEYGAPRLIEMPSARGPVRVHVLRGVGPQLAAYALIYRGATVGNPYAFQISVAPELLFTGQRPLTLVFAEDTAYRGDAGVEQSGVVRQVVAAVVALTPP